MLFVWVPNTHRWASLPRQVTVTLLLLQKQNEWYRLHRYRYRGIHKLYRLHHGRYRGMPIHFIPVTLLPLLTVKNIVSLVTLL